MPGLVPVRHRDDPLCRHDGHPAAPRHDPHPRVHPQARPQAGGGTARILSATVSRTAHRWFVSFTVQVERAIPAQHARPGSAIGVDLGVKTLLTGVDDAGRIDSIAGPKRSRSSLRQAPPRLPRALPQGARRREPAQARRPARPHPRESRQHPRRRPAQGHERPRGPIRDRRGRRPKRRGDAREPEARPRRSGPGIRRGTAHARLQDHLERRPLVIADRWYPSSKTCSGCGWRKPSLTLTERTFKCGPAA